MATINLTTKERVKATMEIDSADYDDLIDQYIAGVSAQIQKHMARLVEAKLRTQFYDVEKGAQSIFVDAIPITAVTNVWNDSQRNFTASPIDTDNYWTKKNTGQIAVDGYTLNYGPGAFKITYTGGLGANAAAIITAYPDIAQACDLQVSFLFQRRQEVGLNSVSAEGGSMSVFTSKPLLPTVVKLLKPYRRIQFSNGGGEE